MHARALPLKRPRTAPWELAWDRPHVARGGGYAVCEDGPLSVSVAVAILPQMGGSEDFLQKSAENVTGKVTGKVADRAAGATAPTPPSTPVDVLITNGTPTPVVARLTVGGDCVGIFVIPAMGDRVFPHEYAPSTLRGSSGDFVEVAFFKQSPPPARPPRPTRPGRPTLRHPPPIPLTHSKGKDAAQRARALGRTEHNLLTSKAAGGWPFASAAPEDPFPQSACEQGAHSFAHVTSLDLGSVTFITTPVPSAPPKLPQV